MPHQSGPPLSASVDTSSRLDQPLLFSGARVSNDHLAFLRSTLSVALIGVTLATLITSFSCYLRFRSRLLANRRISTDLPQQSLQQQPSSNHHYLYSSDHKSPGKLSHHHSHHHHHLTGHHNHQPVDSYVFLDKQHKDVHDSNTTTQPATVTHLALPSPLTIHPIRLAYFDDHKL